MRRADRQVTDIGEILGILGGCEVCRLAFSGKTPYIVPMSFGYLYENGSLTLYFHCAGEGEKLRRLKACADVCFEADRGAKAYGGESPCSWTTSYESVIGFGKAHFITDESEKRNALALIMKHYGFGGEMNFEPSALEKTTVFSVTADSFTAKRHN